MKLKSGFIPPLLLIVIAALLFSGGVYVYTQNKKASQPVTATSATQTQGWKTYTNTQYGFSFSYPTDWGNPTEKNSEISFAPADPKSDIPNIRLDINVVTNSSKTVDQLISDEDRQQGISVSDIRATTLGGADAKSFLVRREGGFANYGLIAVNGKYAYEIDYGNWFSGDPVPASVQQSKIVLDSFKFINKIDTSTWKTYRNDEYKFQLQYPSDWELETTAHAIYIIASADGKSMSLVLNSPATVADLNAHPNSDGYSDFVIQVTAGKSLDDWFQTTYADTLKDYPDLMPSKTEAVVNGLPALKISDTRGDSCASEYYAVYFNTRIYTIQNPDCDGGPTTKAIYSSFRFLQ